MKAVIAKGPLKIAVEDRPIPKIQDPGDVILKITSTALCGSDLHIYHGKMPFPSWDFIMGHEAVGIVHEIGSAVKKFKVGDRGVSAFSSACGNCFFCTRGLTCRCETGKTFGTPGMEGLQAEYVRIPSADISLFPAPDDLKDEDLILLGDILPTGYSVVKYAYEFLHPKAKDVPVSCAIFGCGPVGLLGVLSALQRFQKVFAIDGVQDRLDQAERLGAIPINLNDDPVAKIKALTDGRGPDACCEVVGATPALNMAVDLVRTGGVVAACGLNTSDWTINGLKLYLKNVACDSQLCYLYWFDGTSSNSLKFGRTSVIDLHEECIELLRKLVKENKLEGFVQHTVSVDKAPEYYDLFDKRKIGKTLFRFDL